MSDRDWIVNRVGPAAFEQLPTGLAGSELHSVLLEVMQRRAALRLPAGERYQIFVTAPDGASIPLVDGGTFDWLAQLNANRRAVFVATGAGAQLIALGFRE